MTDTTDELTLVKSAKIALLNGIVTAASRNSGESARHMAEAYSLLEALSVDDENRPIVAGRIAGTLQGRR